MKKVITLIGFCLISASSILAYSGTSIPLPKNIYQAPICATSYKALTEIKQNLENEKDLIKVEEIMKKGLTENKLLSAQELLKVIKEQIRKDKNNSSTEVIQALNERVALLENKLKDNSGEKIYVFDELVRDVTEESLYKNQNYNLEVLRKLCNGGDPKSNYVFEIYEF